jgi:hypothetical protein
MDTSVMRVQARLSEVINAAARRTGLNKGEKSQLPLRSDVLRRSWSGLVRGMWASRNSI